MKVYVAAEKNLRVSCNDAINIWVSDVTTEADSVMLNTFDASDSVTTVFNSIPADATHFVMLGNIAIPQVKDDIDNHGDRDGDCDAPYCTASLDGWGHVPDTNKFEWFEAFPADAVRCVSRIDFSNCSSISSKTEAELFNTYMDRNHAYRTGVLTFADKGLVVNWLEYLSVMSATLLDNMKTVVSSAENLTNTVVPYVEPGKCVEVLDGRTYLSGYLMSGGNPAEPRMYYIDGAANLSSGRLQIAMCHIFCSFGWQFNTYPLQKALLIGGSLCTQYSAWGRVHADTWSNTVTVGDAIKKYHTKFSSNIFTLLGDCTLYKQENGSEVMSQAQLDALQKTVANLSAKVDTIGVAVAALQAQASTGGSPNPPKYTARVNCGAGIAGLFGVDDFYLNGRMYPTNSVVQMPSGNTLLAPAQVYTTVRYNALTLSYNFISLPAGTYTVTLHFIEPYFKDTGHRHMNIAINGTTVETKYDPATAAGAGFIPDVKQYTVIVSAGEIKIDFVGLDSDPPCVAGIEVVQQ